MLTAVSLFAASLKQHCQVKLCFHSWPSPLAVNQALSQNPVGPACHSSCTHLDRNTHCRQGSVESENPCRAVVLHHSNAVKPASALTVSLVIHVILFKMSLFWCSTWVSYWYNTGAQGNMSGRRDNKLTRDTLTDYLSSLVLKTSPTKCVLCGSSA